jgi:hypothetical protein
LHDRLVKGGRAVIVSGLVADRNGYSGINQRFPKSSLAL